MESLSDLIFKNRILILKKEMVETDTLSSVLSELEDRRLAIFLVNGDKVEKWGHGDLQERLSMQIIERLETYNGVLIGLDGSTKIRFENFDASKIFEIIDSMPMRRAELQNKP